MKKHSLIAIALSLFVIFIYALPYLILKHNIIISVWDNFDSYFVWYKVIAEHGYWLPLDYVIPNFYEGIPRSCFHSELIFQVAIFSFLSPLKAYITVDLLSRIIGFFGMYLLLKDYFLKGRNDYFFCACALCFAFIPNYLTLTFLTLLGQPLLLWAFLNIRRKNLKAYNWVILCLMPFCVNFELITPFFLTCISILWAYDFIKTKKPNYTFLFAIALYCLLSLITIYRFLYLTFFSDFVPHRQDWSLYEMNSHLIHGFFGSIFTGITKHILRDGEGCTSTITMLFALPVATFSTIYAIYKKYNVKPILACWALLLVFSSIYGICFFYEPTLHFTDNHEIIKTFQFNRFYFLVPLVWYVLFAFSLDVIRANFVKFGKFVVAIVIFLQMAILLRFNIYFSNSIWFMNGLRNNNPTYKEYFAQNQFNEIRDFIGKPQASYKVATVGLPFNIVAFNGFYSLTGYFNVYPLEYKHTFEKISERAFDEFPNLKSTTKYWGHQLVLLPNENLFDVNGLKALGCQYIFSSEPIKQATNSQLILLKVFDNISSIYKVYVYKVK